MNSPTWQKNHPATNPPRKAFGITHIALWQVCREGTLVEATVRWSPVLFADGATVFRQRFLWVLIVQNPPNEPTVSLVLQERAPVFSLETVVTLSLVAICPTCMDLAQKVKPKRPLFLFIFLPNQRATWVPGIFQPVKCRLKLFLAPLF